VFEQTLDHVSYSQRNGAQVDTNEVKFQYHDANSTLRDKVQTALF